MDKDQHKRSEGSRLRGAIQKGRTGEKVPGFDPAAAPFETDSEAGGAPAPGLELGQTPELMKHDSNASSHASALRQWEKDRKRTVRPFVVALVFLLAVIVILILILGP
ncbi:hypothetical protein JAU75_13185 [Ochrobactrum sp. Q0168]|uniref:hypothetical protein n=1 Tax=Ochrobactrum sp. Q0168 TaxID=2793241 RepID=UPI0018EE37DD|nr:hypothetical protein [Ochrobactrum sp. Q0168]